MLEGKRGGEEESRLNGSSRCGLSLNKQHWRKCVNDKEGNYPSPWEEQAFCRNLDQ